MQLVTRQVCGSTTGKVPARNGSTHVRAGLDTSYSARHGGTLSAYSARPKAILLLSCAGLCLVIGFCEIAGRVYCV
jgi:hypothetical protein